MAAFDMSNNAIVVSVGAMLEAMDDNAPVSKLPRVLAQFGLTTAWMASYAAFCRPPSDRELAYFLGLGGIFIAGVAEVWAAIWVSGDATARRGKGKKILYASVVPLVIAAGLGGFPINFKN